MPKIFFPNNKKSILSISIFTILLLSTLLAIKSDNIFGVELFSKEDKPFGKTQGQWLEKYWPTWINKTINEVDPKDGDCLLADKSGDMVLLAETTVSGTHNLECEISSNQGLMIPGWIAWCDTGTDKGYSISDLSKCAREKYNLGKIKSEVKIDGKRLAYLDVTSSLKGGSLDYKINSMENFSDITTKPFKLTIPSWTHKADSIEGVWDAGAQGWVVFVKPLEKGNHIVEYNVRVNPTGALTSPGTNPNFSDIKYKFDVK